MKTSTLMKIGAALAIGAALPLGAIASPPTKAMTERGVIEKVNAARQEFTLGDGHLKGTATFDWNGSTRFVESGKPAPASQLKAGERAAVNYTRHGKQRIASRIEISPSSKTAQARKAAGHS
jgi:hypothetical protein